MHSLRNTLFYNNQPVNKQLDLGRPKKKELSVVNIYIFIATYLETSHNRMWIGEILIFVAENKSQLANCISWNAEMLKSFQDENKNRTKCISHQTEAIYFYSEIISIQEDVVFI